MLCHLETEMGTLGVQEMLAHQPGSAKLKTATAPLCPARNPQMQFFSFSHNSFFSLYFLHTPSKVDWYPRWCEVLCLFGVFFHSHLVHAVKVMGKCWNCFDERVYDSIATVGEIRVYLRADFQSGSRVLKKEFWTFSYLYLWHTMWFHAKKLLKTLKFWKSLNLLCKSGSWPQKSPKYTIPIQKCEYIATDWSVFWAFFCDIHGEFSDFQNLSVFSNFLAWNHIVFHRYR